MLPSVDQKKMVPATLPTPCSGAARLWSLMAYGDSMPSSSAGQQEHHRRRHERANLDRQRAADRGQRQRADDVEQQQHDPAGQDQAEEPFAAGTTIRRDAAGVVADAQREQDDGDDAGNGENRVAVVGRKNADRQHLDDEDAGAGEKHDEREAGNAAAPATLPWGSGIGDRGSGIR